MYITEFCVMGLSMLGLLTAFECGLQKHPNVTDWEKVKGIQLTLAFFIVGAWLLTLWKDTEAPASILWWYALLAYGVFWLWCAWVWYYNRRLYLRQHNKTLKA